jgi:hypothetical protein
VHDPRLQYQTRTTIAAPDPSGTDPVPQTPSQLPVLRDGFAKWPLCWGLAVLVFICWVTSWPVAQFAFTIIAVLWLLPFALLLLALLVAVIWCAGRSLFQRRWRHALSMAAFPLMLLAALPAGGYANAAVDWLTFRAHEAEYLAKINDAIRNGQHIVFFDWGGGPMIGQNRFVVWDERDELVLSKARQTEAWKQEVGIDKGNYAVLQSFGSHFYLIVTP